MALPKYVTRGLTEALDLVRHAEVIATRLGPAPTTHDRLSWCFGREKPALADLYETLEDLQNLLAQLQ